ncbi:BamA/TamA family outer membrane protein [bacterium]|nr:BamA/TamA family outer membrane protein [bacterium]
MPIQRIREIKIANQLVLKPEEIIRSSGLFHNQDFSSDLIEPAERRIQERLARSAYENSNVKISIHRLKELPLVDVTIQIKQGSPTLVSAINTTIELPQKVKNWLNKRYLKRPFTEQKRRRINRLLGAEFRKSGFLRAHFTVSERRDQDQNIILDLVGSIGNKTKIGFTGNKLLSRSELLKLIAEQTERSRLSRGLVDSIAETIRNKYQELGHYFVRVDPRIEDDFASISFRIRESRSVRFKFLLISGNDQLSKQEVKKIIGWRERSLLTGFRRPGQIFTEQQLLEFVDLIKAKYSELGFEEAVVIPKVSRKDRDTLVLEFTINEGPQITYHEIEFVWNEHTCRKLVDCVPAEYQDVLQILEAAILKVKTGRFINLVIESQDLIRTRLIQAGYPSVAVTFLQNPPIVKFIVTTGPKITIGNIALKQNLFTKPHVIQRELQFQSGDLWDAMLLQETELKLYRTGLFEGVTLEPADGKLDSPTEDLVVRVAERDSGSISTGIGFDTEDGLHLLGEIKQQNLNGEGNTLLAAIDAYFKTGGSAFDAGRAKLLFSNPHIFDSETEFYSEVFAQTSINLYQNFNFRRYGANLLFRAPIGERWTAGVGGTTFLEDLFDQEEDIIISEYDDNTVQHAQLRLEVDGVYLDDRFNPRSGWRFHADGKIASSTFGSDVNYAGGQVAQGFHLPLSDLFTFAQGLKLEGYTPFDSTDVLPLSQRLFLGGRSSLRGFARNKVGPKGFADHVVGGDLALVLNSELKYQFADRALFVLFLDLGKSILKNPGEIFTGDPLSISFSNLRYSPGIGCRYETPIGPLSIDLGFNPDREAGEQRFRVYLSIGNIF